MKDHHIPSGITSVDQMSGHALEEAFSALFHSKEALPSVAMAEDSYGEDTKPEALVSTPEAEEVSIAEEGKSWVAQDLVPLERGRDEAFWFADLCDALTWEGEGDLSFRRFVLGLISLWGKREVEELYPSLSRIWTEKMGGGAPYELIYQTIFNPTAGLQALSGHGDLGSDAYVPIVMPTMPTAPSEARRPLVPEMPRASHPDSLVVVPTMPRKPRIMEHEARPRCFPCTAGSIPAELAGFRPVVGRQHGSGDGLNLSSSLFLDLRSSSGAHLVPSRHAPEGSILASVLEEGKRQEEEKGRQIKASFARLCILLDSIPRTFLSAEGSEYTLRATALLGILARRFVENKNNASSRGRPKDLIPRDISTSELIYSLHRIGCLLCSIDEQGREWWHVQIKERLSGQIQAFEQLSEALQEAYKDNEGWIRSDEVDQTYQDLRDGGGYELLGRLSFMHFLEILLFRDAVRQSKRNVTEDLGRQHLYLTFTKYNRALSSRFTLPAHIVHAQNEIQISDWCYIQRGEQHKPTTFSTPLGTYALQGDTLSRLSELIAHPEVWDFPKDLGDYASYLSRSEAEGRVRIRSRLYEYVSNVFRDIASLQSDPENEADYLPYLPNEGFALFNTGLLSHHEVGDDPIYAVFYDKDWRMALRNPNKHKWSLLGFASPRGVGDPFLVKVLARFEAGAPNPLFASRCSVPTFEEGYKLDDLGLLPYHHIIVDNIDRYPIPWLRKHLPEEWMEVNPLELSEAKRKEFYDGLRRRLLGLETAEGGTNKNAVKKRLSSKVKASEVYHKLCDLIKPRLLVAYERAQRGEVVPVFHLHGGQKDQTFALPLELEEGKGVDLILPIKIKSASKGVYTFPTILRCEWAYKNILQTYGAPQRWFSTDVIQRSVRNNLLED